MNNFNSSIRDHSHFKDLTAPQIINKLAELEQSGNLLDYASKHFPDYVQGSDVLKFTLLVDLGIA
tara:strand:- start:22956 stop:23150 length:195 start_codon:yes stop_codon:yes gene_type:complete